MPTETAPLRYPDGQRPQRRWQSALKRADWVQDIRIDGRENLLDIVRHLALHADWSTLESMPGWDTLVAKTGLSNTTVGRWFQELRLRGWIVVIETGSTPLTRPMSLCMVLPNGKTVTRGDGQNRRAVYGLRIPLSPDEALAWAAEQIAAQATAEAEQQAAEARARMVTRIRALLAKALSTTFEAEQRALTERANELIAKHRIGPAELTAPDVAEAASVDWWDQFLADLETAIYQAESELFGDKKGSPTLSSCFSKKTCMGGYAREATLVDDCGAPVTDRWGGNDQKAALRAPALTEEGSVNVKTHVPTTGFEMLIAADYLRRTLPIMARLSRKAVRAVCRPFWRAGWSNLDLVHAMDHLPSAFAARAGTPIGRGPADGLDAAAAWWWIKTRLDAWRDADNRPRRGYYQTRGRRQALKKALIRQHGRAGAALVREVDLAAVAADIAAGETRPSVLTPERIAEFGRRVAAQLADQHPADPTPPAHVPTASDRARSAAAERLDDAIAEKRAARAAERHARVVDQYGPQLDAARAELAEQTGATGAAPVADPATLAEWDALTDEERHERARAKAAGYRRARHVQPRRRANRYS